MNAYQKKSTRDENIKFWWSLGWDCNMVYVRIFFPSPKISILTELWIANQVRRDECSASPDLFPSYAIAVPARDAAQASLQSVEPEEDNNYCNLCRLAFSTEEEVTEHVYLDHGPNSLGRLPTELVPHEVFPCITCNNKYKTLHRLNMHILKRHIE